MTRVVLLLISAAFAATGVTMLVAPEWFYWTIPGVSLTGPYNTHFIRDVGFAFLTSGGLLGWGAATGLQALMIAGAAWPAAHALYHLQLWIARGCVPDGLAAFDIGAVIAPAALAMALAVFAPPPPRPTPG